VRQDGQANKSKSRPQEAEQSKKKEGKKKKERKNKKKNKVKGAHAVPRTQLGAHYCLHFFAEVRVVGFCAVHQLPCLFYSPFFFSPHPSFRRSALT